MSEMVEKYAEQLVEKYAKQLAEKRIVEEKKASARRMIARGMDSRYSSDSLRCWRIRAVEKLY